MTVWTGQRRNETPLVIAHSHSGHVGEPVDSDLDWACQSPAAWRLAHTLLAGSIDDAELADGLADVFMSDVVARLPRGRFSIDDTAVRSWVKSHLLLLAQSLNEARALKDVRELNRQVRRQVAQLGQQGASRGNRTG